MTDVCETVSLLTQVPLSFRMKKEIPGIVENRRMGYEVLRAVVREKNTKRGEIVSIFLRFNSDNEVETILYSPSLFVRQNIRRYFEILEENSFKILLELIRN